jgi:hypothetical protein
MLFNASTAPLANSFKQEGVEHLCAVERRTVGSGPRHRPATVTEHCAVEVSADVVIEFVDPRRVLSVTQRIKQ